MVAPETAVGILMTVLEFLVFSRVCRTRNEAEHWIKRRKVSAGTLNEKGEPAVWQEITDGARSISDFADKYIWFDRRATNPIRLFGAEREGRDGVMFYNNVFLLGREKAKSTKLKDRVLDKYFNKKTDKVKL
jgi:hypothetical protein